MCRPPARRARDKHRCRGWFDTRIVECLGWGRRQGSRRHRQAQIRTPIIGQKRTVRIASQKKHARTPVSITNTGISAGALRAIWKYRNETVATEAARLTTAPILSGRPPHCRANALTATSIPLYRRARRRFAFTQLQVVAYELLRRRKAIFRSTIRPSRAS